jgi:non-homologous end joining protein Ku
MLGEMESRMVEFEAEWTRRCREIEELEQSPHEANIKKLDFEIAANMLKVHLTTFDAEEFDNRIERLGWAVDLALTKAKTKFKDKESKRLKKAWGPLAGLIFFVKAKLGFY